MAQESTEELLREATAKEIYRIGTKAHINFDTISKAISNGTPLNEWKDFVLDHMNKSNINLNTKSNPEDRFSLVRFIRDKIEGNPLHERERVVIDEISAGNKSRQSTRGTLLPNSILNPIKSKRTLTAGVSSAGGATVDDEIQSLISPLDPETPVYSHAWKVYPSSPWSAPVKSTASVATWKSETEPADESNPTFSSISQTPKHLAAWTSVTRELISSSSVDIEALVRSDLRIAMNLGIERNLLRATGVTGQPTGLENNTDIQVINRASVSEVTYDEILQVEEAVLDANVAIMGDGTGTLQSGEMDPRMMNRLRRFGLNWVVSPKMRRLLKSAQEPGPGASIPLWNTGNKGNEDIVVVGSGTQEQPTILGYPAYVSTYISDDSLFFGYFHDLLFSQFGNLDIVLDPYTLGPRGITRIFAHLDVDWFLRHTQSLVRLSA